MKGKSVTTGKGTVAVGYRKGKKKTEQRGEAGDLFKSEKKKVLARKITPAMSLELRRGNTVLRAQGIG